MQAQCGENLLWQDPWAKGGGLGRCSPFLTASQLYAGAEDTFREGSGWGEESKGPGNSSISFFCVFPLQHSWQPKGLLCPWKASSRLSRQHNREKILGAWKAGLLFKLVLPSASLGEHRAAGFPLAQPAFLP